MNLRIDFFNVKIGMKFFLYPEEKIMKNHVQTVMWFEILINPKI